MSIVTYLIGLIALCTGIILIRKSDEKQNAVIYLVFTAVLFMVIQCVEAGIINLIPFLRINAVTFGCLHILEGTVLWYFIICKKYRQRYFIEMIDVWALSILAFFVILVAVRQFGVRLDNFNFRADSDMARHYMWARNVAENGQLIGLFFSALNSGLIMNSLHEVINEFLYYRIFILFETGILFLNGAMFWVLVRRYLKDRFSLIIGIVLTVAYILGYPWNSMVFGASYLSTGILCVTIIMFMLDMYFNNVYSFNKALLLLLAASCFALLHSYSLFVPPVLGSIVLAVIIKYVKSKSISVKKVYVIGGGIFVVCLLVGAAFLYFWLVRGFLSEQLDVLSWWGYTYGTLFADFLIAVPFCILWFVKSIKAKEINTECIVLFVFLSYIFVFFLGNYFGKISAYYYFKTYCILWIVAFMIILRAIAALRSERPFMLSYILTWGLLFIVFISSAEEKLRQEYNLNLTAEGAVTSDCFGLYNFNIKYSNEQAISREVKTLYMEAAKLSEQIDEFIPYIGEYTDHEWTYFALAGMEHVNVLDGKNYDAAVEELQKYSYILSVECEEPMADVSKFLNTLPAVYENEAGKIYKVDLSQTTEGSLANDTDVDIILRYGFPKFERMGWVEQNEYVNSLQVIKKIDTLGVDINEFLYPERASAKIEETISYLETICQDRERVAFDGTTSEELQQTINENPNAVIDIHSKMIELNHTIVLQNNTVINGNGATFRGYGLEYGFIGEDIQNICLNNIRLEGKINYGVYLIDCNNINISECRINRLLQKPICIIGNTKGLRISGNELCTNSAGGLYISGAVSQGLIEANEITGNNGASKWMSGIVLTDIEPKNKHDIWEDFDNGHKNPLREDIYGQVNCTHDIVIKDNNISDNRSLGIYADGAYKCYVIGNTVSRNTQGNVSLEYGTIGFFLEGNFLDADVDAGYPSVSMNNAAYNILRNNVINDVCVGIKLEHTAVRNLIMENIVQGTGDSMDRTYGIEIGSESIEDKTEKIDYAPCYENIICRNNITGNHYTGIFLDEGCYVNDVFDNIIMGTQTFAIEAISDMFNSIVNNALNAEVRNKYVH